MRQREFITLLSSSVAAWPSGAQAQQPPLPVIGSVWTASRNFSDDRYAVAFREGLAEMSSPRDETFPSNIARRMGTSNVCRD